MRNKKKNIIFYHPNFDYGGVERTNLSHAKNLKRIDNNVRIFFLSNYFSKENKKLLKDENIFYIETKCKKSIFSIFKIHKILKKFERLNQQIVFIACQNYASIISIIIFYIFKYQRAKLILFERNHIDEMIYNKNLKKKLIFFLMRIFYSYADVVLTNSFESSKDLSKFIKKKVFTVYNKIYFKKIRQLSKVKISDKDIRLDKRKILISIGRLEPQKDFFTLIKAFNNKKIIIKYKLLIIGSGSQNGSIKNYIRKNSLEKDIILKGYKKNPYNYLAKSYFYIMPSLYEGLPNSLIDSINLNKPVLSSNCKSGPKEIFKILKFGKFFKKGDVKSLRKEIIRFDKKLINYKENIMKNKKKLIDIIKINSNLRPFI